MVEQVSNNGDNDGTARDPEIDAMIAEGVAAIEQRRRGDAEAAFRKVLAREPDNADALRRLGVVVYMGGDFQEAVSLLELAISLAPEDADAHNNLAAILIDQDEVTDAEAHLRRALELQPGDADINFNLGLVLLRRGNHAEARPCFEAVTSVRPDDADAHHNLGLAFRQEKGRAAVSAAMAAFRKAVEIDGNECDSLVELATLLREEGCLPEALAASQDAVDAHGDDGRVAFTHGAVLYDFGRYADAIRFFQRAVSAKNPDFRAHDYLGRAFAASGDLDGAIRAFRRGLEQLPESKRLKRNLRDVYSRLVPTWHLPMMNDTDRNEAYQKAIEKAVSSDDVVLDVGAGTGLFSMMAARAGAKQVVACELLRPMAEMARRVISHNGYEDRITVLEKQSNELDVEKDLPEPASVVISDILDVTLIGAGIIPSLRHATRHLARPDAKIIPAAARVLGMLIEWPSERAINPVGEICGFDFKDFDLFRNPHTHMPFDGERETHRALTKPFEIARFDFHNPPDFHEEDHVEALTLTGTQSGTAHAVAIWFDLDLDDEISISTGGETNLDQWHRTAQFLDRDLPVRAGQDCRIIVSRTDTRFFFETLK